MTTAEFAVSLPDPLWIADISRSYPDASFRVLATIPGERHGYALVRIFSSATDEILARMEDHADVTPLDRMHRGDAEVTVQIETTHPLRLVSARASRVPIVMPVEIQDVTAMVRVTGSRSRLSKLGERLRQHGLTYELEWVREELPADAALTARQRDVLLAAVGLGYYETPRSASLTDLADELGIAKSTCSETLNRAEGEVIKRYVEQLSQPEEL